MFPTQIALSSEVHPSNHDFLKWNTKQNLQEKGKDSN